MKRTCKELLLIVIMAFVLTGCVKAKEEPEPTPGIQQTVTIVKEEQSNEIPQITEAPLKAEEPKEAEASEKVEISEAEEECAEDNTDWSAYYEKFMETPMQDIYGKNIQMDSIIELQGIEMSFSIADMDGLNYSAIGFGDYVYEIYKTKEKTYACSLIDGERNWKMMTNTEDYAVNASTSDLFNSFSGTAGSFTEVSDAPISSIMELKSYEGSVQEDVLCDVLRCEITTLEYKPQVTLYIIRDTGKLHHMDMDIVLDEKQVSYKIYYKEIEALEIPLEARVAPESTVEELVQLQSDVLMAYSASVSQQN